jgi:hypothetical protein
MEIATVFQSLDLDFTLLNTTDMYDPFTNEQLEQDQKRSFLKASCVPPRHSN